MEDGVKADYEKKVSDMDAWRTKTVNFQILYFGPQETAIDSSFMRLSKQPQTQSVLLGKQINEMHLLLIG